MKWIRSENIVQSYHVETHSLISSFEFITIHLLALSEFSQKKKIDKKTITRTKLITSSIKSRIYVTIIFKHHHHHHHHLLTIVTAITGT